MTRISPPLLRMSLAALALLSAGCREQAQVLALVLAVKGGVALVEPKPANLAAGATIGTPSTIRTEADGAIVFSALPGVIVRLEGGAEIALEQLTLRKRADEMISRYARLQLRRGLAYLWVDEFRQGTIELQVRTPAGAFEVHGPALAELSLLASGATRVICVSGSLSAAGTELAAGQWATVRPAESRPAAQVAADTDEVWQALLKARETEPQFLDLQARQRQRTPVHEQISASLPPKN